jgi:hypothetical protein
MTFIHPSSRTLHVTVNSDTKGQSKSRAMQFSGFIRRSEVCGFVASLIACLSTSAQQPPEITTQPQSQSVPVTATVTFNVQASGHKPLAYQWRLNGASITAATNSSLTLSNVQCWDSGNYSVRVTNDLGSTISSNAVLTVNDTIPPQITCPSNRAFQCYWELPPPDILNVAATDNSGSVNIGHLGDSAITNGPAITISRTYQAVDPCGNTSTCTQTLSVHDTFFPIIICEPDYTTTPCDGFVINPPTVSDNCGTNVQVGPILYFSKIATNGLAEVYRTIWVARDQLGNTDWCYQDITIVPFHGYVPPPNSGLLQSALTSGQGLSATFSLQRGLPDINAGVTDSGLGPRIASPCGTLSGTNLWFRISALDTGLASVRVEGATLSVIYEGYDCDPQHLNYVTCSLASNRQSQMQFSPQVGLRYWLALQGVRSSTPLRIAYGFDPPIETIALQPDHSIALTSGIAPAVIYKLQAAASVPADNQDWSNLLTLKLTNSPYLRFLDTNAAQFTERFYRIVPGP